MKTPTETSLVKSCLAYLAVRKIFAWRNNSGAIRATYKGKTRLIRFGAVGSPDILGVLPGGRFLGIECKVGRNKPTHMQQRFLEDIQRAGGLAIVARSIRDVEDGLKFT